jgi:hypothetical protein
MRINLVNYEEGQNKGILSKFAYKMKDALIELGHEAVVSKTPDPKADVNHHINYLPYKFENSPDTINTLMVTHIWDGYKLDAVKAGVKSAIGICMSKDTEKYLETQGIDKSRLTTILPAHDCEPRRPMVIAILTNLYPDGCKRVEFFQELVKTIDKTKFAFRIMGKGWETVLTPMVADGLQVEYVGEFDSDFSRMILQSSDYYLYTGVDEGSMGALDAKNAGLKLIIPPVGFNIDIGIEYPWSTQEELNNIFKDLAVNPVEDWTWNKYVQQHLNIWKQN